MSVQRRPGVTSFSAVDEIGCYFDRPGEPNSLHVEVHLPGRLEPDRLREALMAVLAATPRARARRIAPRLGAFRFRWEIPPALDVDPVSVGRWADASGLARERARFLAHAPDLDLSPPLRLRISSGPSGDVLLLNAHHSAMDGVSCLELIRSLARAYSGDEQTAPAARPSLSTAPEAAKAAMPTPRARRLPVRPARIAPRTTAPGPGYGYRMACLPRPSRQARDRLSPEATVNDILLAAFALTVARWNAARGRPAGAVQITVPVNARGGSKGPGPEEIGNVSRLAAVVVGEDDRADPARLIGCVVAQTRAAKARPSGSSQIGLMGPMLAPPWLPVAIKARIVGPLRTLLTPFTDTAKLSNWGTFQRPPRFGEAGPARGVWTSGPGPMPRGLSLTVVTVGDRLHLTLRYRYALLDAAAAASFVDLFLGAYDDLLSGQVWQSAVVPAARAASP